MLLQVATEVQITQSKTARHAACPQAPVYTPVTEIKVIGAGFGHSGSTSFECALAALGFHPVTPGVIRCNDSEEVIWDDWAKGGSFQPCLEQLLQLGFDATTSDRPTGFAWQELMASFPEAKVVQIVHPLGVQGFVDEIVNWKYLQGDFEFMSNFMPCVSRELNITDIERREMCANDYLRIHDEIRQTVPVDRLLTFSVADGWEPLASYLGVPVPNISFPNKHGGEHGNCFERWST